MKLIENLQIPDASLLTKAMEHYLKVSLEIAFPPSTTHHHPFVIILTFFDQKHNTVHSVKIQYLISSVNIQEYNILVQYSLTNIQEHNTVSKAPMPLVMFRFAVEHTSRFVSQS